MYWTETRIWQKNGKIKWSPPKFFFFFGGGGCCFFVNETFLPFFWLRTYFELNSTDQSPKYDHRWLELVQAYMHWALAVCHSHSLSCAKCWATSISWDLSHHTFISLFELNLGSIWQEVHRCDGQAVLGGGPAAGQRPWRARLPYSLREKTKGYFFSFLSLSVYQTRRAIISILLYTWILPNVFQRVK